MGKPYCCLYDQNIVLPQPQSPPLTVCSSQWHSHNLHLQPCAQVNGTATISTFKPMCVLMSMLGGATATIFTFKRVCVCSYQCLEVEEWEDLLGTINGTATTSTFKPVCVLMSMLGGGTATISTLKYLCVCSCQCLEVEEWEDLLGITKERRSSFLTKGQKSDGRLQI